MRGAEKAKCDHWWRDKIDSKNKPIEVSSGGFSPQGLNKSIK
jgi:hypothetical protein